jgi:prepilin-type N-terminal cleavage/methylation domain-containing protein
MRRRQGFTIVELLVAMALIVFLMAILSEAFVAGLKVFRDLKALGDMNERLRAAGTLLTNDLAADHFEGKKRLSDPNFWQNGPPREGFFRIWQIGAPTQEGGPFSFDLDGIASYTSLKSSLHFTIKKRGNGLQDFLSANVPAGSPLLNLPLPDSRYQDPPSVTTGGVYKSQWAEVAWFVKPNGQNAGSTPLYALYRRQRVCVPDSDAVNYPTAPATPVTGDLALAQQYQDVSFTRNPGNGQFHFNSPIDLTIPERRFGMNPSPMTAGVPESAPTDLTYPTLGTGADLVLTDVLSFDVRVLANKPGVVVGPGTGWNFYDLNGLLPTTASLINPSRYQFAGQQVWVFDTWSNVKDETYDYSNWNVNYNPDGTTSYAGPSGQLPGATATSIPLRRLWNPGPLGRGWSGDIQVKAIKVSIRIWDFKTNQARQITIIQDM